MRDGSVHLPIEITPVLTFNEKILKALQSLLQQLTTANIDFSENNLKQMIHSENAVLLIARNKADDGRIVGTLSYIAYRIPTGLNFRIEDVVVDHSVRGRGVGRALMRYAIAKAEEIKADKVDLTSSPERIEANKLYQTLGFRLKKTNVYRYSP